MHGKRRTLNRKRETLTIDDAKARIKRYLKRYYCGVRDDVFDWNSFQHHLYGYTVSLSHEVGKKRGWQGHNWRQEIRKLLLSFAYDEIDKIDRGERIRSALAKIFTFGIVKR